MERPGSDGEIAWGIMKKRKDPLRHEDSAKGATDTSISSATTSSMDKKTPRKEIKKRREKPQGEDAPPFRFVLGNWGRRD